MKVNESVVLRVVAQQETNVGQVTVVRIQAPCPNCQGVKSADVK